MKKKSLLVLVTMSLLVFSVLLYAQGRQRGKTLTVDVVPDFNTFSFVDLDSSTTATAGEPFIVQGDLFEEDTLNRIGDFICRGFFITLQPNDGDGTSVTQSYEIDGRGTIFVAGNEPGFVPGVSGIRRAIIGATGDFNGSGEATIEPIPTGFRITFNFRD